MKLTVKRMGRCFWIVGDDEPIGPYVTIVEAEDDRRGLVRFYKYKDVPGYVTSDEREAGK